MADRPPKPEDDKLPEAEAEARFNELVGRLVNTPPNPHKPKGSRPPSKAKSAASDKRSV